MASNNIFLRGLIILLLGTIGFSASLYPTFYDKVCPQALPTIKKIVQEAVAQEKRMGASLLRLHFHDCFVQGCDASVLLDPSSTIDSEKNALPNLNSIRGFNVIDRIKGAVDKVCRKPTVSCADILALAARDSVVALGGPSWTVPLGRRDSTTANRAAANTDLPSPFADLPGLINSFNKQGLDVKDLVALSGGHVVGFATCQAFRTRIYNESNIDPVFARARQTTCPLTSGNTNLAPLDPTAALFDTKYFSNLVSKRGLLHSDQALFSAGRNGATDNLVKTYSTNFNAFGKDFGNSMIKMGNIKPLTGQSGQIRVLCRKVNP